MKTLNRCDQCHGEVRVSDTRPTLTSGTYRRLRRYQCLSCGHRSTTIEVPYAVSTDRAAKTLARVQRAVQELTDILGEGGDNGDDD